VVFRHVVTGGGVHIFAATFDDLPKALLTVAVGFLDRILPGSFGCFSLAVASDGFAAFGL
jgi:hypothetical protein